MLGPWELVADDGSVTPVTVPGTVTQAFSDDLDARSWVFRSLVGVSGDVDLVIGGVATSYDVVLDGVVLITCHSMHTSHRIPVTVAVGSLLEIRVFPLTRAMPVEKPPRARWRTRIVDDGNLRLIRTALLGRCPGIAPGPPIVGPWRAVALEPRSAPLRFTTSVDGADGVIVGPPGVSFTCAGVTGVGTVRLPSVSLWWPHTHGSPVLHDVVVDGDVAARVGFRSVENGDPSSLSLIVNDVPIWARGAVWTPPGLLAGLPEDPYDTVLAARDAGMNVLRVPGLAPYEDARFFEVCDELGVMVWHDLALANLDVPHDLLDLDAELSSLLSVASGHPSLVVVCGGSETAQQVAMLGLDPTLWESDFLLHRAPALVGSTALWLGNSPVGGALPFRVGSGVAHWFGVGGYRRALSDVRTSAVRFASECLAFANPSRTGDWVPGDNGATWDFADVVDHYATELGRPHEAVVGELMAFVFGEWRRSGSPNRGGIILWFRDLQPGAGWGVLESSGFPKPPYWHVRRVLAPQAIWFVDEGLDGVALHLANDRPLPWVGDLRVTLYRSDDVKLDEVIVPVAVEPWGSFHTDVEGLLGRFVDTSYAFRFGDPQVGTIVASFGDAVAFHFPVGRPTEPLPRHVLTVTSEGSTLTLLSSRVLDGVQVSGAVSDNCFCLEPGVPYVIEGSGEVTALNLA